MITQKEKLMANFGGLLVIVINLGIGGIMLLSSGCGAEDLIRDLIVTRLVAPEDGLAGADGLDGSPGQDGIDGAIGAPGIDGVDGIDGSDGTNGQDGQNGLDGQDGTITAILDCFVICPGPSWQEPCEIVCPEEGRTVTRLTIEDAVLIP